MLQMTVATDSLRHVNFDREAIMKNDSLVEEVGWLLKTVSDEQAA